ncbi:mechanosensitive ion channel domain-containing protein [Wenyingzhuangia sp. IMCC45574]
METYYTKIVESLIIVVFFIVFRIIIHQFVEKKIIDKVVQKTRSQLVKKVINLINLLACITLCMIVWGVKKSDLAVFVGSVLTIVGVAFFAQWSLLSNITSSILLFFGHTVKIGDTIAIMEAKDYEIQGKVVNIGLFFTKIKLLTSDDEITLPNNIFIQKTIRTIHQTSDTQNN